MGRFSGAQVQTMSVAVDSWRPSPGEPVRYKSLLPGEEQVATVLATVGHWPFEVYVEFGSSLARTWLPLRQCSPLWGDDS